MLRLRPNKMWSDLYEYVNIFIDHVTQLYWMKTRNRSVYKFNCKTTKLSIRYDNRNGKHFTPCWYTNMDMYMWKQYVIRYRYLWWLLKETNETPILLRLQINRNNEWNYDMLSGRSKLYVEWIGQMWSMLGLLEVEFFRMHCGLYPGFV